LDGIGLNATNIQETLIRAVEDMAIGTYIGETNMRPFQREIQGVWHMHESYATNQYLIQLIDNENCCITERLTGVSTYQTTYRRGAKALQDAIEMRDYETNLEVIPPPIIAYREGFIVDMREPYTAFIPRENRINDDWINKLYPLNK
jgi:hypothetical protein